MDGYFISLSYYILTIKLLYSYYKLAIIMILLWLKVTFDIA